jgi:lipoyl(octanoyl) transferase
MADAMLRSTRTVDWIVAKDPIPYGEAVSCMEGWVEAIAYGRMPERVWLLEHPPVLTAGTGAAPEDLLKPGRFTVVATGRGGRYTYHAPGQRIAYVMLDLRHRGQDVRAFVRGLEAWIVGALGMLGVEAFTDAAGTGVWTRHGSGIAKVGAIGLRIRRWVSFHGIAINVLNDLDGFEAIVPCGIREHGVTRLRDLVALDSLALVDEALRARFDAVFGATCAVPEVPA